MADIEHSLQTYVSDMLALEEHIRVPFETQLRDGDLPKYPSADALIRRLSDLSNTHIAAMKSALDALGGHEAHPVKSAVVNVEGWFASAIDKVRKTKIAKALRDDYTALSLCTVSYSMLLSTANAYGEPAVMQLAERHLRDYAQILMEIALAMPDIVVQDLQETGVPTNAATTNDSRRRIQDAWRPSPDLEARMSAGSIDATQTTTAQR